jgi:cytochrome P450
VRAGARIGDTELADGEVVWLFPGAAHRDPAKFPDPNRFDVGRRPNPHLGLGHGVHLCLGAHLARLEGRIALGQLLDRLPEFEVADVDYAPSLSVRGPARLTISELQRV